ncbi:toprim domain-containing protein [Mucilaginibacter sp. SJ]|uniref:toprim domain-containing protein n=1 Tax=Mucilaginibacter sp. SJ TaxID=3029053 RepID=UPI0023A91752|nr:toprim domain-containing protein [Mucilaginibacter sp. SJ]WEA01740.1 toprim domain-containing protein [Mucilaginibacter sp. SJ]
MSNLLTAKELKERSSIVDLLQRLGYRPAKKYGRETMYRSMLRDDDSTPSFSVNDDLGVWFDHGTRKGGNIIDFGLAYWKELDFNSVVIKIQEVCALAISEVRKGQRPRKAIKVPHYIINEVKELGSNPAITEYLCGRGVFEVARGLLSEVYYFVEDQRGARKQFFAAGWQNENKGWEVRNKYFKGCLGPKGITCVQGHGKKVTIFEGFINFLSWRVENPASDSSIIILNSLALLPVAIQSAKAFTFIDIFFDRDNPGLGATKEFIRELPYATDRSSTYEGFNDYNDKLKASMKVVEGTTPETRPSFQR